MVAHERRRALEIEDAEECDEQRVDALLELSAQNPVRTHRTNWTRGARWIVVLSVIAWLIVLLAVMLTV